MTHVILESEYNFCINEAIYISQMWDTFGKSEYNVGVGWWVTDASRSGVLDERWDIVVIGVILKVLD